MNFLSFRKKYQKTEVEHFPHQVSSNPLVSVLVQTYNHEAYIAECLDGILNQKTDFDFEILLGEDASTDNTREICIDYARKYPEKIKLFLHHPSNKIKVMGINTGNFNAFYNYYQSRGEFIAFCEGDDFWKDPFKLQKQVDFLKVNPEFVLTYHKFEEKYESSSDQGDRALLEQPEKDLTKEELSGLIYLPLLSSVCFRKCFGELPEEMIQVINVDSFLISLLGNSGKAKFQPEIEASVYRRHSGGIWTKKNRETQLLTKILTFQKLACFYKDKDESLIARFQGKLKKTRKMLLVLYLKGMKPFKAVQFYLNQSE
ncbi:glycosyltransferase family 2 protein [Salegentibacter sp. JZCK2]|uniref:glycosyltransferase family 2 protein n=1 Tax=Salegentibacter tibetensis TaxID=2873600 RepID=UPI001CCF1434|nr:glycosyltransferase family A protein [Salegentibacter tibetensis]MBZ9729062.1 glycosyltransferase family 2 protein [Salegentibacter tibetensis]